MKKIFFDNSIHLGQFCISSEEIRIAAKGSQVSLSTKGQEQLVVGFVTFNENSWSDHTIWSLEREPQDAFYRFMDPFHSVKQVNRIPLRTADAEKAIEIAKQFSIDMSNALTCAVAIFEGVNEIHSFYGDMDREDIKQYMMSTHNILVMKPDFPTEVMFMEEGLESSYQESLETFRKHNIDMITTMHS